MRILVVGLVLISFFMSGLAEAKAKCKGRIINPITHVAWKTLFPLYIAGFKVADPNKDKSTPGLSSKNIFCLCDKPVPRVGIPIAFWEPFRAVDVTRKPYCMVNLGGMQMNLGIKTPTGDIANKSASNLGRNQQTAFYHVHWYLYPLMFWMNLLTDFICMQHEDFDVAYLTELDPLWRDDELSLWLNPEAVVFGNPIMQSACAADCAAATFTKPFNHLFWCAGCQGGVYPLTGTLPIHPSGVDASTLITERMILKMHRELLLHRTTGKKSLCNKYPVPWWKKDNYKLQQVYPSINKSKMFASNPVGRTTVPWSVGKEVDPTNGDFGYLMWRFVECCAL